MAYGLRFEDTFFDVDEHKWLLRIFKRNYTGSKTSNSLTLGPNAVQVSWEQKGDDFFSPIIGSSCKISMYVTEDSGGTFWNDEDTNWESANFSWDETNFDFVQPIDDREYKVELLYASSYSSGDYQYTSYWTGFIIQDQYSLPLKPFPYLIEFYASDLVGTLKGYPYNGTTERPTCIEVIKECMKNINEQNASGDSSASLQLDFQTLCRIKPNTSVSNGDPFLQTFIRSKESMRDENDIPINCKTILESILQMFNCRMFQRQSKWVIISNDAMALSSYSGTGKVFINYDYDDVSASTGTTAVSTPTKNVNSSLTNDTIQPLNNDLLKILKRPCVRARTNVRVKDTLFNEITNGTYESNTAPTESAGGTPSWGRTIDNWQTSNGFAQSDTEYAVNSTAANFGTWPIIVYGIEPASGDFSAITIGNESSAFNTEVLKNTTGSLGTIGSGISFKFSYYAYDPEKPASTLLNYEIRYRFKVGTHFWDSANEVWTTNATDGNNTIVGASAQQWIEHLVTMPSPPAAGQLDLSFYRSEESAFENADFRMYFDNVIIIPDSKLEIFSTRTNIIKAPYNDNSGVLKTVKNRFGQLEDIIYSNCLVSSTGSAITNYTHFDNTIVPSTTQLEVMMNTLRLNDLAESNDLFEGTFRKVNTTAINPSGNRVNALEPIDMLTKPKMNFSTLSGMDNELAIDRLEYNISKNRYKLHTHTPGNVSPDTPVTPTITDIRYNRNFYENTPED